LSSDIPSGVSELHRSARQAMRLTEIVSRLEEQDAEGTIYARQPWSLSSDACVEMEGSDGERSAKADGLSYFLEVSIAVEFLEDWRLQQKKEPSADQSCERLIQYAINDA